MSAFTLGFTNEIVKLGFKMSPDTLRALLAGSGTGAVTGAVGNLINPSATPGGRAKGTVNQAIKGALIGGAAGVTGHKLRDILEAHI